LSKRSNHKRSERENRRKRELYGYDGGKKIKGRKKHIAEDTEELFLQAQVTRAAVKRHRRSKRLLKRKKLKTVKKEWADCVQIKIWE
jgi:predicted nucleic acid-binding protein